MTTICSRLRDYLDQMGVPYTPLHHEVDFTSQETAAHTCTRGREFAKTVVIWVDGRAAVAVLPAHHRIDFSSLRQQLEAEEVRLASEEEMGRLFPDCELGAEPALANLYELPVYLSSAMFEDEAITFNAGTHEEALRMKFRDFLRLSGARVLEFSVPA